jgi:hypothetical protein
MGALAASNSTPQEILENLKSKQRTMTIIHPGCHL